MNRSTIIEAMDVCLKYSTLRVTTLKFTYRKAGVWNPQILVHKSIYLQLALPAASDRNNSGCIIQYFNL
jgi:hypothetical protein